MAGPTGCAADNHVRTLTQGDVVTMAAWHRRGRPAREGGASAVEFALIVPVLLMLVFGIIGFGIIFAQQLSLGNSARQAARYGAVDGPSCADIITQAQERPRQHPRHERVGGEREGQARGAPLRPTGRAASARATDRGVRRQRHHRQRLRPDAVHEHHDRAVRPAVVQPVSPWGCSGASSREPPSGGSVGKSPVLWPSSWPCSPSFSSASLPSASTSACPTSAPASLQVASDAAVLAATAAYKDALGNCTTLKTDSTLRTQADAIGQQIMTQNRAGCTGSIDER